MNKQLLLIIFSLLSLGASAQKYNVVTSRSQQERVPDSTAYYMTNETSMANSENDAKFLRLIIKADSGLFRIEDYYMDAKPKMLAYSSSRAMRFENGAQGKRVDYYPNGNIQTVTYYNKGQFIGDKETHYPNGNLYTLVNLKDNAMYLEKCLDSTGNVLTNNGNGKWVDFDNKFVMPTEGNVVNGKRVGEWVQTRTNGDKTTGVYKNGILVSGDLFLQDSTIYSAIDTPPSFAGGDAQFYKFLGNNIKYPSRARDARITGRVIVTFIVEKNGALSHIRIVRGIGSGCDEESIRVLKLSPSWIPGSVNGRTVRVQYSIPINFTLQNE